MYLDHFLSTFNCLLTKHHDQATYSIIVRNANAGAQILYQALELHLLHLVKWLITRCDPFSKESFKDLWVKFTILKVK